MCKTNFSRTRFQLRISFLSILLLLLSGCATMIAPKEETLSLSGRYHDVIKLIEAKEARGEDLSLRERYRLCEAYLQAPVFRKLFPCVDQLERQLEAESDHMLFMGVGLVTSMPWVMRARAYLELGKTDQAIQEAEKAYRIAKKASSGYDTNRFYALALLAFAHEKKENHQQADSYLDQLEKESVSFLGWGVQILEKRKAKTFAYFSLKRYRQFMEVGGDDAARFLISLAFVTGDTPLTYSSEVPVRFALAKAKYETGRQEEALEIYNELLSHPQITQSGSIYWQILFDMGRHFLRLGKTEDGINILKKAISHIEEKRSTIDVEAGKIGFVGDKEAVYLTLVAALVDQNRFSEAFEYVERAKARALVDMLASKKHFGSRGLGKEKELNALLENLEEAELNNLIQDHQISPQQQANTRSIVVQLKNKISQASPELASLITVTPLEVLEIQQLIPSDETLVEFFGNGDTLFSFIVSRDGVHGIKQEVKSLNQDIEMFRKHVMLTPEEIRGIMIKFEISDKPRKTLGFNKVKVLGGSLYKKLIQPIEDKISTKNITIVPHGALHYLPFNALNSGGEYLIERYNIRVLPSSSVMQFIKRKREGQAGKLLVFGNPDLGDPQYDLPFAQTEAIAITKDEQNSKVLLRKKATETAVKKFGSDFRWIHFATHGTFNPDTPLESGLLLSKDNENDGTLTVGELYDLNLNADLIVLSACETALGKVANGDDLLGFTRGFLYAGTNSIVSSLWKVDDRATSILMQEFYKYLKDYDKRTALRKAQLWVMETYNPHPYFWAAFQGTGSMK